ncbi:MAG: tetratricopeptide repeat protein [Muribaculaceae bacterium]|nr:tetratricopeptide repeat protein [Muribaculaceae bacterium]
MSPKLIYSFLLSIILSVGVTAARPASTDMADRLYENGDYAQAADAYLSIVEIDGASPALYYNLANSYALSGDYGNAMLYYLRANRLDPSNKEIKNNLNYFESKIEDSNRAELRGKKISVTPDPETFFSSAHRVIAKDVRYDVWARLGVVSFILFLCGVAVYLFCSNVLLRKTGFFGGISLFIMSVMFTVFAFMSASYFDSHDEAVLMAYKTPLLIEPSSDSKPATNQLCQGTRFEIIAEETDVEGVPTWYKVRLNADIEGWLRSTDISIL